MIRLTQDTLFKYQPLLKKRDDNNKKNLPKDNKNPKKKGNPAEDRQAELDKSFREGLKQVNGNDPTTRNP